MRILNSCQSESHTRKPFMKLNALSSWVRVCSWQTPLARRSQLTFFLSATVTGFPCCCLVRVYKKRPAPITARITIFPGENISISQYPSTHTSQSRKPTENKGRNSANNANDARKYLGDHVNKASEELKYGRDECLDNMGDCAEDGSEEFVKGLEEVLNSIEKSHLGKGFATDFPVKSS